MTKNKKGSIGSSFDDYLDQQGTRAETTERAVKRVLVYQLAAAMEEQAITKEAMAKSMHTSRSQLDRLLDPENEGVTLAALQKAAHAVGRELTIELR